MGDAGVARSVRAKSGVLRTDKEKNLLLIDLYEVSIDQPDKEHPLDPTRSRYINAQHYPVKLDFSEMVGRGTVNKSRADLSYGELISAIRDIRSAYPDLTYVELLRERMVMLVEANKRFALALSCFAFTLLGIPLGLKSHRKESSIGIGISLLVVFFFYFFLILADSLVGHPQYRSDLIIWIPILLAEAAGFILLSRTD
jgi:lipopolysaccharide export system permease protein